MLRTRDRSRGGTSGGPSSVPWYENPALAADGVFPKLIADFQNERYAVNNAPVSFTDLFTFTRSTTGTYFDANNVMQTAAINTPRFDHDPSTGTALGLLIEESRTNSFTYSADLANWLSLSGASISSNAITAPDGTQNADLLLEDTSSSYHRVSNNAAVVSGTTYTISAFVKQKNRRYLYIRTDFFTASVNNNICFDLQSGTVIYAAAGWTATITMTANGWYRISITATATSSATKQVYFSLADAPVTTDSIYTYTGNGTSGVYIWGAQCEVSAFPTSYIPTTSTVVTRAAEIVTNTSSNTVPFASWYNQVEGCLFTEAKAAYNTATTARRIAEISNGSLNNRWSHNIESSAGNNVSIFVNSGGVTQFNNVSALTSNEFRKFASSVKTDGAYAIGGSIATDDTVTMPASVNQLNIGQSYSGNHINGWVKSLRYYPARISNSELQRITT